MKMIKGLEYQSYKDKLRELRMGKKKKKESSGSLLNMYK